MKILVALFTLLAASAMATVVEAYFGAGHATNGFFQSSVDMTNWMTFYSFPYPTNGAWVQATNQTSKQCYYRAGLTP